MVLGQVFKNWLGDTKVRLLIPAVLREEVFKACHTHCISGHWNATTAITRARNYFLYPRMTTDMTARYLNCQNCLAKKKTLNLKDSTHNPARAAYPMQRLYIDLYGPLPEIPREENKIADPPPSKKPTKKVKNPANLKYILSIEDGWSRYVNLVPITDKSAATVATALMDEFLSRFGMPAEIFSDQVKEFCNQVFEEQEKFEQSFSPAYSPSANLVERSQHSLISNLQERYSLIFKKIYSAQTSINRTNAALYTNRKSPLKVGDLVYQWTKRQVPGKPDKITNRWTGLFVVTEVLNNICVKIDSIHQPGRPVLTTIHHLQKYTGPNVNHYDNPRPDLDPGYPPEDEIENFLGSVEVPRPMGMGTQPQQPPGRPVTRSSTRVQPPPPIPPDLADLPDIMSKK